MQKVLIITYYWPPAGGPGVQRWLKFATYLPNFQIEPIVYVPENANYPIKDTTLSDDVPDSLKIISHPIREPYSLANMVGGKKSKDISRGIIQPSSKQGILQKALLFARGNFFIPDARVGWVAPSVKYLIQVIRSEKIKTIITTGPPHSVHLIGLELKKKLNIRWIADFRDPWTTIGYHQQLKMLPYAKDKHTKLEKDVLDGADQLVVTSWVTQKEFETKTNTPVSVITNGFEIKSEGVAEKEKFFTFSHIGSLLSRRNPIVLWETFSEILEDSADFRENFKLKFAGVVSDEVLESLTSFGLKPYVEYLGYLPHPKAVSLQKSSRVLLLIEINSEETKAIIPGKLFEYMASGTPIIALGPEGSDVKKLLNETETGYYFTYSDKSALKQHIYQLFHKFQANELEVKGKNIMKFSRKSLTAKLSELI
ncbi:glycosyltransferase [Aegicerativicinus sediminis]|uniref:glycosyltransferase n=1 Tax=Aegicerativicinus sediminis TaxID=2893202 RepID=UPI001E28B6FD|nr:glycosyltransferase [Aegicerativicinus sediminis]